MALDDGETLLDQLPGRLLSRKGDEAEVLGLRVLAPVNRSLDLDYVAVLQKRKRKISSVSHLNKLAFMDLIYVSGTV